MLTNNIPADVPSPLAVGYSGGRDSTVLLHWLQRLQLPFEAIHCHHGLQPQADAWAAHCQQTCDALGVPLHIVRLDAQALQASTDGIEAAARHARLAAFAHAVPSATIALAHHQDDQAETFLLRALRGSSAQGLGAMRRHAQVRGVRLWRPLLTCTRNDLQRYALEHGLHWIEDPSNSDLRFDRNFLRQQIVPLLQSRWPAATQRLARSAELAAHDADALDTFLHRQAQGSLHPLRLATDASAPDRHHALRRHLRTMGLAPLPETAYGELDRLIRAPRPDSDFALQGDGYTLRYWRDHLHVTHELPDWTCPIKVQIPPGGSLDETFTLLGRLQVSNPSPETLILHLHPRRGGERIQQPGRSHSHTVKDILNTSEVPPWARQRLPLISDVEGTLWWIGHIASSEAYERAHREHEITVSWQPHDLN